MIRLNLMPWRQELRLQKNREFASICVLFAASSIGLVFVLNFFLDQIIGLQNERNGYLDVQLEVINKEIENIKNIEVQKTSFVSGMNIITQLETARPRGIHLLEQLVLTLPNGIWLEEVEQTNNSVLVKAKTTGNQLVPIYLRNLNQSYWFSNVVLSSIDREAVSGTITLELRFSLIEPNQGEEANNF